MNIYVYSISSLRAGKYSTGHLVILADSKKVADKLALKQDNLPYEKWEYSHSARCQGESRLVSKTFWIE